MKSLATICTNNNNDNDNNYFSIDYKMLTAMISRNYY